MSLVSWGANSSGQLGRGTVSEAEFEAKQVVGGEEVARVVGGGAHTLATTFSGGLLAWGSNNVGQLGLGGDGDMLVPTSVPLPQGLVVADMAAGWDFSVLVDTEGNVWTCGSNAWSQLGGGVRSDESEAKHVFSQNLFSEKICVTDGIALIDN